MNYIKAAFEGASIALAIAAIMIPILSWATQVLSYKLMPQAAASGDSNDTMQASMKTMNTVMPLMSAVFCFTFPVGLGIYWIASAVVRSIQQLVINRLLDKMDINDLINENMKKLEKKRTKEGLPPQKITNQANQSTKILIPRLTKAPAMQMQKKEPEKLRNPTRKQEMRRLEVLQQKQIWSGILTKETRRSNGRERRVS